MKTTKLFGLAILFSFLALVSISLTARAQQVDVVSDRETCSDGKKNNHETDVDCGGVTSGCNPCGKGKGCGRNKDCNPGLECNAMSVCASSDPLAGAEGILGEADGGVKPASPDLASRPDLTPPPQVFIAEGGKCTQSNECGGTLACVGGKCTAPPQKPAPGSLKEGDLCEKNEECLKDLDGKSYCEVENGEKRCRLRHWQAMLATPPMGREIWPKVHPGEHVPPGYPRARAGYGVVVRDPGDCIKEPNNKCTKDPIKAKGVQKDLTTSRCRDLVPLDGLTPLCAPDAESSIEGFGTASEVPRILFFRPLPYKPPPPPPETCEDEAQNQDETDVDCGGDVNKSKCPRCQEMDRCKQDSDCDKSRYTCDEGQCRRIPMYCRYDGAPKDMLEGEPDCAKCQHDTGIKDLWAGDTARCKPKDKDPFVRIFLGFPGGIYTRGFVDWVGNSASLLGLDFRLQMGKWFYASASGMAGTNQLYRFTVVADLKLGLEFAGGYLNIGASGLYATKINLIDPNERVMGRSVGGGGHVCLRPFNRWEWARPIMACATFVAADFAFPKPGGRGVIVSFDGLFTIEWLQPLNGRRKPKP